MTQSKQSISRFFGALKYNDPPITLEDMEKAIKEHAIQRYKRAVGSTASLDRTPAAIEAEAGKFNYFDAHAFEPDTSKE